MKLEPHEGPCDSGDPTGQFLFIVVKHHLCSIANITVHHLCEDWYQGHPQGSSFRPVCVLTQCSKMHNPSPATHFSFIKSLFLAFTSKCKHLNKWRWCSEKQSVLCSGLSNNNTCGGWRASAVYPYEIVHRFIATQHESVLMSTFCEDDTFFFIQRFYDNIMWLWLGF